MKKTIKGLLFALMALISVSAIAQEKSFEFYFKDFSIKAGEKKTIQLYLKNNFLGRDFQIQVFFPEGIKPVPTKAGGKKYFVQVGRALADGTVFSQAYVDSIGRLRMLSNNFDGESVYEAGDAAIAELTVEASADFNSKVVCQIKATPDYGNKLNYDGEKNNVVTVVQKEDKDFAAYPAVTLPWLLANGVEGGEYGIADPVAVVSENELGAFIQDAARTPMRVKTAAKFNVAGCAAEAIMGKYTVVNGNPCLYASENMAAPEEDNTVTAAVKSTTLNNVLFNPETNEVVKFGGYMRERDNTICAYKGTADQGQCIALDWSAAGLTAPTDGSYFTVTGPVQLKMTWPEAEKTAGMTGKDGEGAWKNYILYPVAIDTKIPTGVADLNADKAVAGVKYVNVAGVESNTPFEGVNIVVTTYTDGTKAAVKVIK